MERSWRGEEEEDLLREWEVLPRECDMVYFGTVALLQLQLSVVFQVFRIDTSAF